MTMGWYEFQDGNIRRAIGASGGLFQGGVSIGAAKFLRTFVQPAASTPIIHELEQAVAVPIMTTSWKGDRGVQFIEFTLPTTGPPETPSRVASNTPVSSVDDSGWQGQDEIENAPAPRSLPPVAARSVSNNNIALLFVALLILGTLIIARPRRQRR
jgi:hypothetical protein